MDTLLIVTLALIVPLILQLLSFQRQFKIKRWRRSLSLDQHSKIYHALFAGTNGFKLSRQARLKSDAMEYTYGEIEFTSFIALIHKVKPNSSTIFYDLGSGIGTAVIACALVFPLQKSCGIELFQELHEAALSLQKRLCTYTEYLPYANKIHFQHGNFLTTDFSSATLIFINATALVGETWERLNQRLEETAPHATIITTSKKLLSSTFILTQTTLIQMNFGIVHAYIYSKNS